MTVEQFEAYLESYPPTMPCWRYPGKGGAPTVIAGLNYSATHRDASTPLRIADMQNAVATAAGWTMRYMSRQPGEQMGEFDREDLWHTAVTYHKLRNHLTEVRDGRRGFKSRGRRVRLPYNGDPELYGLAVWLDLADIFKPSDQGERFVGHLGEAVPVVEEWHQASGGGVTWFCAPEEIRDRLRTASDALLAATPTYLPADTATGRGYSLGMALAYWRELSSLATYNHLAMSMGSQHKATVAPEFPRQVFIEEIARSAGIPVTAAEAITTLLTLDTDRPLDVALTPLLRLPNDSLFVMTSLVMTSSPERNLLKASQADPQTYGRLGNLLGHEGEQKVARLVREGMGSGTLCATRVNVRGGKGQDVSDLDVVVYSPHQNLLVVLEVKWHIGVDGAYEARTAERTTREKHARLDHVREEINQRTVKVAWPDSWPTVPADTKWRWYLLTNNVLPAQHRDSNGITIRSYQMLNHLLPVGFSARTLASLLDTPPTPQGCFPRRNRLYFGPLTVDVETVDFPTRQPPPLTLPAQEALPTPRSSTPRRARLGVHTAYPTKPVQPPRRSEVRWLGS